MSDLQIESGYENILIELGLVVRWLWITISPAWEKWFKLFYKLPGKREVLFGLFFMVGLIPHVDRVQAYSPIPGSANLPPSQNIDQVGSLPAYLKPIPAVSGVLAQSFSVPTELASVAPPKPVVVAVSSPNLYEAGQCTWGVKQWRPDLPNNLGNADTWFYRARADGLSTGLVPRVGAAGQEIGAMHVVLVLGVNSNGTILIREMNYDYVPYHVRERVAPASEFEYIY